MQRSDTRNAILAVLRGTKDEMTPDDIAKATRLKRNTVDQRLLAMLRDGEIIKTACGKYSETP